MWVDGHDHTGAPVRWSGGIMGTRDHLANALRGQFIYSVDCGDVLQNETNMWIEVEIHHTALADHKYTQTMHGNSTRPFGT